MRRVTQAPAHYKIELHQEGQAVTAWRAIKRMGPNGFMSALAFTTLAAAQTYARRMIRQEVRIVAVERDGRRRAVNDAET